MKSTLCLDDLFSHHFHVGCGEGGRRAGILAVCTWLGKQKVTLVVKYVKYILIVHFGMLFIASPLASANAASLPGVHKYTQMMGA